MKIMKNVLVSVSLFSLLLIASSYVSRSVEGRYYGRPDERYYDRTYQGYWPPGGYYSGYRGESAVYPAYSYPTYSYPTYSYPTYGYPVGGYLYPDPIMPGEDEADAIFRENQYPK